MMYSSKSTTKKRLKFRRSMAVAMDSESDIHRERSRDGIDTKTGLDSSGSSQELNSGYVPQTDSIVNAESMESSDNSSWESLVNPETDASHSCLKRDKCDRNINRNIADNHVHFQLRDPRPPSGEKKRTPTPKSVVVRKLKPASEWDKPKPKM